MARLSFFYGVAQVEPPQGAWQDAQVNLPLEEGFALRTQEGRAEVQFENGSLLRLAQGSTVELSQLRTANGVAATEVHLTAGSAIVEVKLAGGETFRLTAANLRAEAATGAILRLDVSEGNSWLTVIDGSAQADTPGGGTSLVTGQMLRLGADNQIAVEASPEPDDFDTWSADRDRLLVSGYATAEPYIAPYQPEFYSAAADLSNYGYWGSIPGCGYCWIPYGVPIHWMPFGIGSWFFYNDFGWTWVSAEPWGWLPYHFGRWFFTQHGWAWSPNPVRIWHPGAVEWLTAGNRTAWVPAGTFRSTNRPAGAAGFVLGSEASNGVMRSERGTGMTAPSSEVLALEPARPPAPSRPRGGELAGGGPTIVYDPLTRTYVSAHPPSPSSGARETSAARSSGVHSGAAAIGVRPQFGAPQGYSPAASTMVGPSAPSTATRPTAGPMPAAARFGANAAVTPHYVSPPRPAVAPMHAPPAAVHAPAPVAHRSGGPPHH